MRRVAIAGGGIIGLTIALELACRGMQVEVFERGRAMEEASWAAAGMLAADDPENPVALGPLARLSLSLYPAFLARLSAFGPVPLLTAETLQICDAGAIAAGQRLTWAEAAERVPGIRVPGIVVPCGVARSQQVVLLQEHSLDPRALCRALPKAAQAAGVVLHEHCGVLDVRREGAMLAIETTKGRYTADGVVVSTGCWAAHEPCGNEGDHGLHRLPSESVVPRKGQMVLVREPAGARLLTVLRNASIYIVPRANGRLVIGATVEDAGFDRTSREEATAWLLQEAAKLWTPLGDTGGTDIEAVWTGLRPATHDHLPVIGAYDDADVIFATGHYRNGILLAPATAACVAGLIEGRADAVAASVDLAVFRPGRFAHQSAGCVDDAVAARG